MADQPDARGRRAGADGVAVLGLGPAGLAAARRFAAAGLRVLGFDPDREHVTRARAEFGAGFEATDAPGRLAEPDAAWVCTPQPPSAQVPVLGPLAAAVRALAAHPRPGRLVVLADPPYPGATREVVLPILAAPGLRAGEDFLLACCPDPVAAGGGRVVGGLDPASLAAASDLASRVAPGVRPVGSLEAAEMCPFLEGAFAAVGAALANEMKVLCDRMGVDAWDVIGAVRPAGLSSGPGLGGAPRADPRRLSWAARRRGGAAPLVSQALDINDSLPGLVVAKVAEALNQRGLPLNGCRVAILGLAGGGSDVESDPALDVFDQLVRKRAVVAYADPLVPVLPPAPRWPHLGGTAATPLTAGFLAAQDCVLLPARVPGYDYAWVVAHSRLVVDAADATRGVGAGREKVVRA